VRRRGAAATAGDIQESAAREFAEERGGVLRRFVVFPEGVRQPGVRVQAGVHIGDLRQLFDIGPQVLGTKRAVQPDRERPRVGNRVPERLGGLSGKRAAAGIGDGAGHHDRNVHAIAYEVVVDGKQCGLAIERVEHGLDHQQVDPAVEQTPDALPVTGHQFVEGHVAESRIVHVRRDRRGAAGGPEYADHETRLGGIVPGELVDSRPRQPRPCAVQLVSQMGHAIVGHGHRVGVEGVGLDQVGPGFQVGRMDAANDLRLCQGQQVVVALLVAVVRLEAVAVIVVSIQPVALDHGAHGAIEDEDSLLEQAVQQMCALVRHSDSGNKKPVRLSGTGFRSTL